MSAYLLSPEALQDLQSIWDFVASDSVDAADKLVDRLFEAFEQLARWPRQATRALILLDATYASGPSVPTWLCTGKRPIP